MGRRLILFRHAKAENPVGTADFDRPLSDRGRRDARAAGEWLRDNGQVPELVVCSAARRARQTWRQAASVLDPAPEVEYRRTVYESGPEELLDLVRGLPAGLGVVAIVGHNPTLEAFSAALDPGVGAGGMRTAGIAVHTVEGEWTDLAAGTAPLATSVTARA